jgi:hypothetical protein
MPSFLESLMLSYHPAYDANHCAYRQLLLLENIPSKKIDWNLLKIIDFYVLFPSLLKQLSLPAEYRGVKRYLKEIPDAYETISNPTRLMFELNNIQLAGLSSLIAKNLISKEDFANELISRTEVPLPIELHKKIINDAIAKTGWFIFLTHEFPKIDYYGPKGLKARTGLMEFKYDIS